MPGPCPEYDNCLARRESDAKHKGKVEAMLQDIKTGISDLWDEMKVNRKDIKSLYFRIGLISGGTSLIVSIVIGLLMRSK